MIVYLIVNMYVGYQQKPLLHVSITGMSPTIENM